MTTITIEHELLEKVRDALWQMTKHFNFGRLHESRLRDSEVRVAAHDAMKALEEALAAPADAPKRLTFLRERAQLEQELAALNWLQQQYKNLPTWHDAPTVPGLWWVAGTAGIFHIDDAALPIYKGSAHRWFGPIPPDSGDKP